MQKFTISRDPSVFAAWPDIALSDSGKLICVFTECPRHGDRSHTQIMLTESTDRGRTWRPKHPLTPRTDGYPNYNNARISKLSDGKLVIVVDLICSTGRASDPENCKILLYFSEDDGVSWSQPVETPARGVVPDKLLELPNGRWLITCHSHTGPEMGGVFSEKLWYSDDHGQSWQGPVLVSRESELKLCEASILPVGENTLVAFLRENSNTGADCYKTISYDNGESWSGVIRFPIPGCHRPVSGFLADGRIMITYRFAHGAALWGYKWQNLFACFTDKESVLARSREEANTRQMPLDYDRAIQSDTGYSGWVQFPDGEIYVVNYIVDDAIDKGQIRGYALQPDNLF